MRNLFSYDRIAAGRNIIGRKEQLDNALALLSNKKTGISIYDVPKSGKETFVRELLDLYAQTNGKFLLCEMDLFNVRDFKTFIDLFREKMSQCAKEAFAASMFQTSIDFNSMKPQKVFDLPQVITEESDFTLVVYIKEFQNVASFEDYEKVTVGTIDKIWSKHKKVRYILTGSSINRMKDIFEERKLFYGITSHISLPKPDRKSVCEYISSRFISTGRVIETEESLAIYEITGGNMWYVKQLCSICMNIPAGYINRKIVNEAKESLLSIHSPRFRQVMLDLTANQINLLRALVNGAQHFCSADMLEKYSLNSSANVFRLKEALSKKEIATFDKDETAMILDPLFEYWLKYCYFSI